MKTLILSFGSITGHARRVLSYNVQKNLAKMGYLSWPLNPCQPIALDGKSIMVNHHLLEGNTVIVDMLGGPNVVVLPSAKVYDAATELSAFFTAALKELSAEITLEGVQVTITPKTIDLNPSILLERVMKEAKKIQVSRFGPK